MTKLNVVYTQCPENLDRFKLTYWYEGEPRPGPQFYMLRRRDNGHFVALGHIERCPPPGVMAVLRLLPRST